MKLWSMLPHGFISYRLIAPEPYEDAKGVDQSTISQTRSGRVGILVTALVVAIVIAVVQCITLVAVYILAHKSGIRKDGFECR